MELSRGEIGALLFASGKSKSDARAIDCSGQQIPAFLGHLLPQVARQPKLTPVENSGAAGAGFERSWLLADTRHLCGNPTDHRLLADESIENER
jgi:hypothetical protein